jgi:hypothetical protein
MRSCLLPWFPVVLLILAPPSCAGSAARTAAD